MRGPRQGVEGFVARVDHRAGAVPLGGGELGDVRGVEQVGLAAAGASHPLPAQVVAGEVAVEQVAQHPLCAAVPMHLAQVHQVAGQPHAGVVVHVPCLIQLSHGPVDGRNAGGGCGDISGHLS